VAIIYKRQIMKLLLANPRGFCAGVDRAIEIVDRALDILGAPIYVKHEVVHNKYVVDNLKQRGANFIEDVSDVPTGATLIYSAHGVSQAVRQQAEQRKLTIFDATCPLVTKVHMEVARYSRYGHECILIGHAGHPEVEGTMGQYQNADGAIYLIETIEDVAKLQVRDPENLAYITQTTLSVDDTAKIIDALKAKFPNIHGPKKDDICYATQNRQDAVRSLAEQCDLVLVVGSQSSSNSNRLRELAERQGCQAYLIDRADDIDQNWLTNVDTIGLTAGASAPEILVKEVIQCLQSLGVELVDDLPGIEEKIVFALPKKLRK
jgi:4-hydroxy-3-methylbut-2-enyl diphosphate reductase